MEIYQIITIAIAVGSPVAVALLSVWYQSKRTQEVLKERSKVDADHEARLQTLEIGVAKQSAQIDGVVEKISVQLDSLHNAVTSLTQRLNNMGTK